MAMAPIGILLLVFLLHTSENLGGLKIARAKTERSFTIANNSFWRDHQPFRIFGGEIHYFRIIPQYWKDRLLRAKALGLNTVQTYVPWNVHEPLRGSFEFDGMLDIEAYLKLAQSLDLLVMLRIGPYVCGEWDFGGFPSWLLSIRPELKLRTHDDAYLQLVDEWWNILLPMITPFFYSQGGPVIMLQIENEYGSYGSDKGYLHHLVSQARKHVGENILLYTTDGATEKTLEGGTIAEDNVYAAVDFSTGWDPVAAFELQKKYNLPGKSPPLTAEFYTGWLTHWGEARARTSASDTAFQLDRVLKANGSVVLYMAHGGSNFGFYSGANTGDDESAFQPDITSYDYDAPIGEGGELGEKFNELREVFAKYSKFPLPNPPTLPERKAYGTVTLQRLASLFDVLKNLSDGQEFFNTPVAMEILNQTSGFIIYKTTLPAHAKSGSKLTINKVHDRAQIFIGEGLKSLIYCGSIERWSTSSLTLPSTSRPGLQLLILVENMGRVNYGSYIYDPKGIISSVLLDDILIIGWIHYTLDLKNAWHVLKNFSTQKNNYLQLQSETSYSIPAFYSGSFKANSVGDSFVSLKGWSKGVVFVNGFNLGRYWPVAGPQCSLYIPASLLISGENKLFIFELESPHPMRRVNFVITHDWSCTNSAIARK